MIVFIQKYLNPGKSISFYLFTAIITAVFCIAANYSEMQYKSMQISFLVNVKQPTSFDIYYDVGRGLTENDHQSKQIEQINQDVLVSFCIPVYNRLKLLRFDPSKKYVDMTIKNIQFGYDFSNIEAISFDKIQPLQQIAFYEIIEDRFHFTTEVDGEDPGFVINSNLSPPEKTVKQKILFYWKFILAGIVVSLFLRFSFLFFIRGI